MTVAEVIQKVDAGINITLSKISSAKESSSAIAKYSDKLKVEKKYLECGVINVIKRDSSNVTILID